MVNKEIRIKRKDFLLFLYLLSTSITSYLISIEYVNTSNEEKVSKTE